MMAGSKKDWIFWTPRVLSILFLLFLALFSLDVFEPGRSATEIAIGLFMHNIPVMILGILLWIAWRKEIVGGIAFITAGLLYVGLLVSQAFKGNFQWYMIAWSIQIAGPAFFIGALFLIGWYRKQK